MKVVILAGGLGTRLSEETYLRPKPMVEIGGHPMLWHIMKTYAAHGFFDFVICAGYLGHVLKRYFAHHFLYSSDFTVDLASNTLTTFNNRAEPWRVTIIETGHDTQTGGRLKRIAEHLDEPFCMTYGDGLSDVNITDLVAHHRSHGALATMTAVTPPARFGALALDGNKVARFQEKPLQSDAWINGGYFVCDPSVLDYIEDDDTAWEGAPLRNLAAQSQLNAYRHEGFWAPVDTLRDKRHMQQLWDAGTAPWQVWT